MRIKKIKIQNLKHGFATFLQRVGGNAFFAYLALLLVALVFASFIFYRYAFTIQGAEFQAAETQIKFRDDVFQDILQQWEVRSANSKEAAIAIYSNLFAPLSFPFENTEIKEGDEESTEETEN